MRHLIGIMQGRLVSPYLGRIQAFPKDNWRLEFGRAKDAGLDFVEWIFESFGLDQNPLVTADGRAEMRRLASDNGVTVRSICADYFMEYPLIRCNGVDLKQRVSVLKSLIEHASSLGLLYIILPFVDSSAFRSADETESFVALMRSELLPFAQRCDIELHLETSLPPSAISKMLEQLTSPHFMMNYDSGNSSSLGYRPSEEFAAYGHRIGSVHIKDRLLGGTTVALGAGSADFDSLFTEMKAHKYDRSFVLQVARGDVGGEVDHAIRNRQWLERRLDDGS
jgi:hexulose-6-phosphate isomerase